MRHLPGAFTVADLSAQGELRSKTTYLYGQLEEIPAAVEMIGQFSGALWRSPEEFEVVLLSSRSVSSPLTFRWCSSAATAGIATLRCDGELTSLSLLASGLAHDADAITLKALQQHLLQELRDTPFEPAFALMDLTERPLLATIDFRSPPDPADQVTAALADRSFAASYFRYQGLV